MSNDVSGQIDAICDTFETAWRSGQVPDIRAFVDSAALELRPMLDIELVALDTEYRTRHAAEVPTPESYANLLGLPVSVLLNADNVDSSVLGTPIALRAKHGVVSIRLRDEEFVVHAVGSALSGRNLATPPIIRGYRILSQIGKGGMGVVFKAIQEKANRVVALKTIHAPLLADEEQVQRFKREASAAARLSHEHIVPIYEVGESNGIHFFSMMYVDGMDLETRLRNEPLSCRDAASVCLHIAEALAHAHNLGVIHRDIKPYNILVDQSLSPKLADFGVARLNDGDVSITSTGQILGTAAYMAPEQADTASSEIQATVDIYSLGATLYRCLTGRPPFHAASIVEILRQVHADEPIRPSVLNQEVDADLETICLRCLEKNPNRRFPTAQDLADELRRYLNHEPIHSRKIGKLERLQRWTKRHKSAAASLVLGLALLIFVSAGIPWLLWQSTELEMAELQQQQSAESLRQVTESQRQSEEKRQQAELLAKANEARAANQDYYASLMKVREQRFRTDRKVGWTWEAAELLKKAATLKADGRDATELRSLLANVLLTPDVRVIGILSDAPDISAITVSQDGRMVAVADHANNAVRVRGYRIVPIQKHDQQSVVFEPLFQFSRDVQKDFDEADASEKQGKPLTVRREKIQCLAFDPDGQHVAAGTRNGNIIIWRIDSVTSEPESEFDLRFRDRQLSQLSYWSSGKYLVAESDDSSSASVLEVWNKELELLAVLPIATSTFYADDRFVYALDEKAGISSPFQTSVHMNLFSFADSYGMPSLDTGRFATQTVVAWWESHSGDLAFHISLPGGERPLIWSNSLPGLFFLASHKSLLAYQSRSVASYKAGGTPAFPDDNELQISSLPYLGGQMIRRFAVSQSEEQLAVLKRGNVPASDELPDHFRIHLSASRIDGGGLQRNWTCLSLGKYLRKRHTEGDEVCFGHEDDEIIFTSPVPGQIVKASSRGFSFSSGIGIDVEAHSPTNGNHEHVTWDSAAVVQNEHHSGQNIAVSFQTPRGLNLDERIELRLQTRESESSSYQLTSKEIPVDGWYLFVVPDSDLDRLAESPSVTAEIRSSRLSFRPIIGSDATHENEVVAGSVYVIPLESMHPGEPTNYWPQRLGPFISRSDGGYDAVVESGTLRQWNSFTDPARDSFWRDHKDGEVDIRDFVSTPYGTLLGTDSGSVALVHPDATETTIEASHTVDGPYDSRDGVTCVDFAKNTSLAIAGTLRGQIKVYDLEKPGMPLVTLDAHEHKITALSIDDDAKLIASAAGDGSLRIWNVLDQKASLHFEYTGRSNRISQLKLIDNGRKLLILRDRDAGVVQLDLESFNTVFRDYQMLD